MRRELEDGESLLGCLEAGLGEGLPQAVKWLWHRFLSSEQSIWCTGLSCRSRSSNHTNQKNQTDEMNQRDQMNQLPAAHHEMLDCKT